MNMKQIILVCAAVVAVIFSANAQSPCSSVIDTDKVVVTDASGKAVLLTSDKPGGCDADNDGIADTEDVCPSIPGTAANKGCPEIDDETREALAVTVRDLRFKTGSAELETTSLVILDRLAVILNKPEHKYYKVSIEGHTDNTGTDEINNKLSADRAASAMNYLIKDGVAPSRLRAKGYGSTRPIATNETPEGRRKNRRVEFNVFF